MSNPGSLAATAMASVLSDAPTVGYLSPYGRFAATTMTAAFDGVLSGPVESAAAEAIDMLTEATAQLAAGVVRDVGEAVSSVPLLGTIVNVVLGGALDIIASTIEENADKGPSQHCLDTEAQRSADIDPQGIKPDGRPYAVPSDMFALRFDGQRSVVGDVFVRIGEGMRLDKWDQPGPLADKAEASYQKILHYAKQPVIRPLTVSENGTFPSGIPKKTRKRIRALRRAMQSTYNVPGADGGVALWPIYLDCIAREFDEGRMTRGLAWILWTHEVLGGKPSTNACYKDWRESFRHAMALIDGWRKARHPVLQQDVNAKARLEKELTETVPELARLATARRLGPVSPITSPIHHVNAHSAAKALAPKPQPKAPVMTSPIRNVRRLPSMLSQGQGMSPAERQRIISAIIDAAHGEGMGSVGREIHVDDDLDANSPAPDFHVTEFLDGGDEFSFYGEADAEGYNCHGEHVDEDDVDDPWGYTFPDLATGATRIAAIRKKGIVSPGALRGFDPQPDPPGSLQGFDPQPDPPGTYGGYVGAMRKVQRLPPMKTTPSLAKMSRPTIADMAAIRSLKGAAKASIRPTMVRPAPGSASELEADENYYESAPDYDFGGYQEPDVDAYADGEGSNLDYEDGGYAEFSGDHEYSAADGWGYGYGDFGHEEDYPHDGSTYGWEDCW